MLDRYDHYSNVQFVLFKKLVEQEVANHDKIYVEELSKAIVDKCESENIEIPESLTYRLEMNFEVTEELMILHSIGDHKLEWSFNLNQFQI